MTIGHAYHNLSSQLSALYEKREAANIADWVMENITGWKKIDRLLHGDSDLSMDHYALLQRYTTELLTHRPVQYVLGESWFAGRRFLVNENVLIPRPETEELAAWIIADIAQASVKPRSTLDIGTGSGCLAITLQLEFPAIAVSGMDISKEALAVASENARLLGAPVNFIQSDILAEEEREQLPVVDWVMSNPPYIPLRDKTTMHPNVLGFEPHQALFVDNEDPLLFYRTIAEFARTRLSPGSRVYLETHEALAKEVLEALKKEGFDGLELRKDMQGKDRMVKGVR